jgi:phage/plasmid-associated DNA primase
LEPTSPHITDRGTVLDATGEYRTDEDPVRRFVETTLHDEPGNRIATGVLHQKYLDWCKGEGEVPVAPTSRRFVPELRRLGIRIAEGHAGFRHVEGKALREANEGLVDFPGRRTA